MKTLKVEREAIVREVFEKTEDIDIDVRYNGLEHSVACYAFRDVVRTALLSHEEKVMRRAKVEISGKALIPFAFLQAEITTLLLERNTYNREEKIQEILEKIVDTMGDLSEVLTLPITEENV